MGRLLLIGIVILMVGIGIFFGINSFDKKQAPEGVDRWSREAIVQAIVSARPSLTVDSRPVIEIDSVSMPENGWYVAVIKSVREKKTSVPVRVVLVDNGGHSSKLSVLLGPDTYFSEPEMLSLNIPDSVILELKKS